MGSYMGDGTMGRVWTYCLVPRVGGRSRKQLGTEGALPALSKSSVQVGEISLKQVRIPSEKELVLNIS